MNNHTEFIDLAFVILGAIWLLGLFAGLPAISIIVGFGIIVGFIHKATCWKCR